MYVCIYLSIYTHTHKHTHLSLSLSLLHQDGKAREPLSKYLQRFPKVPAAAATVAASKTLEVEAAAAAEAGELHENLAVPASKPQPASLRACLAYVLN
jgi:hypothetical protein